TGRSHVAESAWIRTPRYMRIAQKRLRRPSAHMPSRLLHEVFLGSKSTLRLHGAQKIGKPPAGLVRIAPLQRRQLGDAVDAEIAEVFPRLAPRADGPRAAPEIQRQRPDVALAAFSVGIAIVQAQHAALADGAAHR